MKNMLDIKKSYIRLAFILFTGIAAIAQISEAQAKQAQLDFPITYIRCPRTDGVLVSGDVMVNGSLQHREKNIRHVDLYDALPDVTRFFSDFSARCDLMLLEPNGTERVLYDCSTTSSTDAACSAMDPAVSFDGKKIAFTVFRGKPLNERSYQFKAGDIASDADNPNTLLPKITLPNQIIRTDEAQIHIVDIASGEVTPLPHVPGFVDSGPAWLSTGRIAFTSNRRKIFHTAILGASPGAYGTKQMGNASQIFTMDIDGRNVEVASYHALGGEQHPFQLKDGRVAFSSWQLFGALPFRYTNGSPGGFTTLANLFHLYTINPDGSNLFALYGQHLGKVRPTHNTTHFLTQSSDDRVWVVDYYRRNNFGLGSIVGFALPPEGQEGHGPDEGTGFGDLYRPRDFTELASWSRNSDLLSPKMNPPEYIHPEYADPLYYVGKLGHPAGAPNNSLLVSWGKGGCSTQTDTNPIRLMLDLGLDNPGCDTGIYFFPTIPATPSTHPSDMEMVVDSRLWHEIMAKPVVPYQAVYGQSKPAVIDEPQKRSAPHPMLPAGSPFGILSASSMLFRETHPINGISFEGELQWGLQGTDTIDYSDDEICGLRILTVQPNDSNEELFTKAGERVLILGEIPVRNYQANGEPVFDNLGMPDTSFRVRFPANMPYLMQGIDCKGRTLNTDQTWQHLRPMEQKTCGGCHVHGKEGLSFEGTAASQPDYPVYTLGEGTVPLLAGSNNSGKDVQIRNIQGYGLQLEFEKDIMPIFASRCNQCHSGSNAAAGLHLDQPGTQKGSTWYCLANDNGQSCVPGSLRHFGTTGTALRRPQVSKYMRFMNSRGSLLYWKASNKRTDNRTDDLYGPGDGELYDIDFGADHPTNITEDELGILARWIDIGAPAGSNILEDTTAPTLSVMAETNGSSVTALLVGTADVPSGIDMNSLNVCIVSSGVCGPNLASSAQPSGINKIVLAAPLTDINTVVRASVTDLSGNVTKTEVTVDRLLNVLNADITNPVVSLPDQIDNSAGTIQGAASTSTSISSTVSPAGRLQSNNIGAFSGAPGITSFNATAISSTGNKSYSQENEKKTTQSYDLQNNIADMSSDFDQETQLQDKISPAKSIAKLPSPTLDGKNDRQTGKTSISKQTVDPLAYLTYNNAEMVNSKVQIASKSERAYYPSSIKETEESFRPDSSNLSTNGIHKAKSEVITEAHPPKTTWTSVMEFLNTKLEWWKNKFLELFT